MNNNAEPGNGSRVLIGCYETMLLIRSFEEALADLFGRNLLGGTSHFCIGQEACAVGVVSAAEETDWIVSNHRGHGHVLARGLDPVRVMGELMGRSIGYCGGRGGSQHLCAMDHCFLGTNGITAGGIPIGTGAALAIKHKGLPRVVITFFGDGASNQGTFHESLNMAGLWGLPILYVCENNGYGMSIPVDRSTACGGIAGRAASYGMEGVVCDGMDVMAVRQQTGQLLDRIRAGEGPRLLELKTYRFCGHSKNDPRVYRTRDEENRWLERDCLAVARDALAQQGVARAELETVKARVDARIEEAVETCLQAPYGGREAALGGVYA